MTRRWHLSYAARFVARWEGLLLRAYQDSGGIWTIGYGHTSGVYPGQVCSKAQALRWLTEDLREAAKAVDRYVTRRMSFRQRIAWISFAFNVGAGGLASSTALRLFNSGSTRAAAASLLNWVHDANGTVLTGLVRRRKAEGWLLTHPYALKLNPHRGGSRGNGKAHRR